MSERCGQSAMTTCRRKADVSLLSLLSMTAYKVPSGSSDPKAGMAACFATTSSAYNGTSAQLQPQAMGVAHHVVGKPRLPQPKRVTPIFVVSIHIHHWEGSHHDYYVADQECQLSVHHRRAEVDARRWHDYSGRVRASKALLPETHRLRSRHRRLRG